jgi:addiction module RelE/StbE family toxin
MIKIQWLPEAFEDLKRLYDFLESINSKVAKKIINLIVAESEVLGEFPEKGRPWSDNLCFRELIVKFGMRGYVVRYRFEKNTIYIVRVWHMLEDRT